jgi:hypothetical protein
MHGLGQLPFHLEVLPLEVVHGIVIQAAEGHLTPSCFHLNPTRRPVATVSSASCANRARVKAALIVLVSPLQSPINSTPGSGWAPDRLGR